MRKGRKKGRINERRMEGWEEERLVEDVQEMDGVSYVIIMQLPQFKIIVGMGVRMQTGVTAISKLS